MVEDWKVWHSFCVSKWVLLANDKVSVRLKIAVRPGESLAESLDLLGVLVSMGLANWLV